MTDKTISHIARARPSGDDRFEALLQMWGRCYGIRLADEDEPSARASHPIAVAMQHGGRTRGDVLSDEYRRRTRGRRAAMARDLGACGVRIVPESYVDAVPCRDDSGRHRGLAADPLESPEVVNVQRAWLALAREFPQQATIVRLAYQRPDLTTNAARARAARLTLRAFEDQLRLGRQWMRAGLAVMRGVERAAEAWAIDNHVDPA